MSFIFYIGIYLFRFWGWGGEDDDLFYRILAQHLPFYREKNKLGRFKVSKTSSLIINKILKENWNEFTCRNS